MQWRSFTFPLIPRRRIAGIAFGDMPSTRRGIGSEDVGDRPYEHGDDPRDIDWAASAKESSRLGRAAYTVRLFDADESVPVLIVCDRRPAMALYPQSLPWREGVLNKHRAMVNAGCIIAESALAQHCYVGYLDYADALNPDPAKRSDVPFFRPPNTHTEVSRIQTRNLPYPQFAAPEDNLSLAFRFLMGESHDVPAETFVFVLSDFVVFPPEALWAQMLRRFDVVPVVIQDPIFEQSFPDVAGMTIRIADPTRGRTYPVRFTRRSARAWRDAHEARLRAILEAFARRGCDPIIISDGEVSSIHREFLRWADRRRLGRG